MDKWPKKLMLRDAELYDDLGGGGQRIFTTAGFGYEKRDYYSSDYVIELQKRIAALEEAALKVVETSGQVDHSGIYAYEMDYRRAIQRLAALLPGRGE